MKVKVLYLSLISLLSLGSLSSHSNELNDYFIEQNRIKANIELAKINAKKAEDELKVSENNLEAARVTALGGKRYEELSKKLVALEAIHTKNTETLMAINKKLESHEKKILELVKINEKKTLELVRINEKIISLDKSVGEKPTTTEHLASKDDVYTIVFSIAGFLIAVAGALNYLTIKKIKAHGNSRQQDSSEASATA